jgi:hypothetical protein
MSDDNLRQRLVSKFWGTPTDAHILARVAEAEVAEWLTSDATVERVARWRYGRSNQLPWGMALQSYREIYLKDARHSQAALAAVLASEGEASDG